MLASCTLPLFLALLLAPASVRAGRSASFSNLGCYADSSVRDLSGLGGITNLAGYVVNSADSSVFSSRMTYQLCSAICSVGGWLYFGLQGYSNFYCFCDNSYGSYGSGTGCNRACSGNGAQNCGGSWRLNMFAQTYTYPNDFVLSSPAFVTVDTYTNRTFWTATANSSRGCMYQCNAGCEGVLYSQPDGQCYLLRFAAIPQELVRANVTGDFYTRG